MHEIAEKAHMEDNTKEHEKGMRKQAKAEKEQMYETVDNARTKAALDEWGISRPLE